MKSFIEISQKITPLSEGLFDMEGGDRLEKGVEKDLNDMFLKSCKGDFKTVYFKDGSVRVNGKLIISHTDIERININCRDFHGKLIIENCPKLVGFEGSFLEKFAVFDGSITINQCPSLVSLKGLPGLIKGDLSVTNCKKLKSIDGVDSVFGNFYWSGNGKKYTEEEIKGRTSVIKKIFCGEEEIVANIEEGTLVTEAFNNQWLQRLALQLKKYPRTENSWETDYKDVTKYNTVQNLFADYGRTSVRSGGRIGRMLDKISNEDIDVYDMSNEGDKKDLQKAFYFSYSVNDENGSDIILVFNESLGEFVKAYGFITKPRGSQNDQVTCVIIPHKGGAYNDYKYKTFYYTKTEVKNDLMKLGTGYTVVVINSGEGTGTSADDRYKLQTDRANAQKGVINPGDVEQYKEIAKANLKRYKDLLAQMRLERKKNDETAGYDKLIDEYEKIQMRVIKMIRGVAKNPKSFRSYEVEGFLQWLRDEQRRNPNYRWNSKSSGPQYYGEYGLMYYFRGFMDTYMDCFGNNYKSSVDDYDYKRLEAATKSLKNAISIADQKLRNFGF